MQKIASAHATALQYTTTSDETITLKLKVDRKPGASSPSDAR